MVLLKFVGTVFDSYMISLHLVTELSIIHLYIYPFHSYMQQDPKYNIFCMHDVLLDFYTHINIYHLFL